MSNEIKKLIQKSETLKEQLEEAQEKIKTNQATMNELQDEMVKIQFALEMKESSMFQIETEMVSA